MTQRLASRWSLRQHFLSQDEPLEAPHPPALINQDIIRLLRGKDSHELEHLLAEAVRCAATLRQLRDRTRQLQNSEPRKPCEAQKQPPSTPSFCYAFELWNARIKTLEMIADARATLRSLTEPEGVAVHSARRNLGCSKTQGPNAWGNRSGGYERTR